MHNINTLFNKKWVITATPLVNDVDDFYSYFKFLELEGMENRSIWKTHILQGINGLKKLNEWIKKYSIQYNKDEVLQLPGRCEDKIILEFSTLENEFYYALKEYSMTRIKTILEKIKILKLRKEKIISKMLNTHILTLITRLKQACNSPYLVIQKIDRIKHTFNLQEATKMLLFFNETKNREEECIICYDTVADYISECGHKCCKSCWKKLQQYNVHSCPTCRQPITDMIPISEVLKETYNLEEEHSSYQLTQFKLSTKIKNTISITKKIIKKKEKVIIVSQYVKMIELVKELFQQDSTLKKIKHVTLQGSVQIEDRTKAISQFQTDDSIQICFISLLSSSEGITLTSANHLINLDIWWNSAKMNQVYDRIYRIGQTRKVHIYNFQIKESIEEKIELLIEKKDKISNLALLKKWSLRNLDNYDDTWIKKVIKLLD
jgi:SNF2 family DNA or RNA helicase